jgi:hypothetical protein
MAKRLLQSGCWLRAGLALFTVTLCLPALAQDQGGGHFSLWHRKAPSTNPVQNESVVHSSQQPAFTIPVEPLGFFPPGPFYQGQRASLVSLDFLDENRLLFTFRAPGLLRREPGDGDERQIRATVLALPLGTVEAEALWTLHDQARYVWMLHDGHFLLRDRDDLKQGDATLELKPLLHFPGPLLWLEMDPKQQLMVTNSEEPATVTPRPGDVPSPTTAAASVTTDTEQTGQPDIVLRILHRGSGQVMLVSHVRTALHVPINSEGYLESLRSKGTEWLLNLNYFADGSTILGKVDSSCAPVIEFISQQEALATTCNAQGGRGLVAMSTDGLRMWNATSQPTQVWPLLFMAPGGQRLARETLTVSHPVDAFSPLSFEDVKGQLVEVYDAANGKLELTAPASPVLDGGGNVAISPSGRRVAVLSTGGIQVYELPEPPPLPVPAAQHSAP